MVRIISLRLLTLWLVVMTLAACAVATPGDRVPMPNEGLPPDVDPYTLEPDPGPCEAAIPRYYYDNEAQMCREFFWGGCGGVIPFETMEECQAGAPGTDAESEAPAATSDSEAAATSGETSAADASSLDTAVSHENPQGPDAPEANIIMDCNASGEIVQIDYWGSDPIDIGGYQLYNDARSHVYTFAPGFTLVPQVTWSILSGPDAQADESQNELLFTIEEVWSQDGDTANLESPDGVLQSQALCFNY